MHHRLHRRRAIILRHDPALHPIPAALEARAHRVRLEVQPGRQQLAVVAAAVVLGPREDEDVHLGRGRAVGGREGAERGDGGGRGGEGVRGVVGARGDGGRGGEEGGGGGGAAGGGGDGGRGGEQVQAGGGLLVLAGAVEVVGGELAAFAAAAADLDHGRAGLGGVGGGGRGGIVVGDGDDGGDGRELETEGLGGGLPFLLVVLLDGLLVRKTLRKAVFLRRGQGGFRVVIPGRPDGLGAARSPGVRTLSALGVSEDLVRPELTVRTAPQGPRLPSPSARPRTCPPHGPVVVAPDRPFWGTRSSTPRYGAPREL